MLHFGLMVHAGMRHCNLQDTFAKRSRVAGARRLCLQGHLHSICWASASLQQCVLVNRKAKPCFYMCAVKQWYDAAHQYCEIRCAYL